MDSLSASAAAAAGLMDPYWLGMGAMVGLGVVLVCEEPRGRFWPCCVEGVWWRVAAPLSLSPLPSPRPHVGPMFDPLFYPHIFSDSTTSSTLTTFLHWLVSFVCGNIRHALHVYWLLPLIQSLPYFQCKVWYGYLTVILIKRETRVCFDMLLSSCVNISHFISMFSLVR